MSLIFSKNLVLFFYHLAGKLVEVTHNEEVKTVLSDTCAFKC